MRVVLGLKAHSGWAVLVAVGVADGEIKILDRRRIELVERGKVWAKQPYHAAEGQSPAKARKIVQAGITMSRRCARKEIRAAIKRLKDSGHTVATSVVLVPSPMPPWSTAEILAVHFRMHKAEGVLFPDSLLRAARACRLRTVALAEKQLTALLRKALGRRANATENKIKRFGKVIGPPWGGDQKNAALAAIVGMGTSGR